MTLSRPRFKTPRAALALASAWLAAFACGCTTVPENRKDLGRPVSIPFMRMEASECYFVDDFMPTPDNLVTGRSGGLFLRYYVYRSAIYKIWEDEKIMLAFYSRDNRCWSLFEEYSSKKL